MLKTRFPYILQFLLILGWFLDSDFLNFKTISLRHLKVPCEQQEIETGNERKDWIIIEEVIVVSEEKTTSR